jgi:ferredoxin
MKRLREDASMATKTTRKIVKIDEAKCNGCGQCVPNCMEGAIQIIDGKARLVGENLCDGLGNCLGTCPMDAITIEERPAEEFDEQAVQRKMGPVPISASQLSHWPVQLALVPVAGPIWEGADVLIAADCVAFALPDFHERLLAGKTLAIACPKLDDIQPYIEKLSAIFAGNDIRSITVAHMEVPCCSGIVYAVREALAQSGKDIPVADVTVAIDGTIRSEA